MLYKKLMKFKMVKNEDMTEYLTKFQDIIEKLANVEIELQYELVTIILLSSLPPQNFIVAMGTRDKPTNFHTLKLKLLEEREAWKCQIRRGK